MILEITPNKPRVVSKKLTWKQELRQNLFKKNKEEMRKVQDYSSKQYTEATHGLRRLFET